MGSSIQLWTASIGVMDKILEFEAINGPGVDPPEGWEAYLGKTPQLLNGITGSNWGRDVNDMVAAWRTMAPTATV